MKLLIMLLAVMCAAQAFTQSANSHGSITSKTSSTGFLMMLIDKDGKPFTYGNSDVEGNPFYNENWGRINLKLANGNVYKDVKARLNTYNNYLHFMTDKGAEMYLEAAEVSRVEMLDSVKKDSVVLSFARFTTQENGKDISFFYKVIADGNVMLLERHRKKIKENKYIYSGEIKRFYEQYEDFYVFAGNALSAVKRKESFWAELMKDKWALVQAYTQKEKLGFKGIDDLQKIAAFYNTLPE